MKTIILLRSNDIITDSRVLKYILFYKENDINYKIIGWDREGKNFKYIKTDYFKKVVKYNIGQKAVYSRILFMIYIIKKLIKYNKEYENIHACDLDTVLPALLIKVLFKKTIIYDIFDWFTDTIKINNTIIKWIIKITEKISLKYSDYIIICEEERLKQIGNPNREILIFPNIPNENILKNRERKSYSKSKLIISYIGGFYKDRNLEILLKVVSINKKVELYIAGFGDENIEKLCYKYSNEFENIKYFGRVKYEIGLSIMDKSNLIYAVYCTSNKNHIYAAPNKYYESLMLGVPIVTNKGTILAEKVNKFKNGYVIGEKSEDLNKLIENLNYSDIIIKAKICKKLWNTKYKLYLDNFLKNIYYNKLT